MQNALNLGCCLACVLIEFATGFAKVLQSTLLVNDLFHRRIEFLFSYLTSKEPILSVLILIYKEWIKSKRKKERRTGKGEKSN